MKVEVELDHHVNLNRAIGFLIGTMEGIRLSTEVSQQVSDRLEFAINYAHGLIYRNDDLTPPQSSGTINHDHHR